MTPERESQKPEARRELDRWLEALDPPRLEVEDGLRAEARTARILTAYRAQREERAASGWASPAVLRLAGAAALIVGVAAGWSVPRLHRATEPPAEAALWPTPPAQPSLAQLYLSGDDSGLDEDVFEDEPLDEPPDEPMPPGAPGEGRG